MRKLREKLVEQLKQGTSPEALALTLVLGLCLGTMPVLGSTTLLCAGAAYVLRLNQPLMQLLNYFAYPVQLLLYVPLLVAGAKFLDPSLPAITLDSVFAMFRADLWGAIQRLFLANVGAVVIWAMVAGPAGALLYAGLLRAVRNFHKTIGKTS